MKKSLGRGGAADSLENADEDAWKVVRMVVDDRVNYLQV